MSTIKPPLPSVSSSANGSSTHDLNAELLRLRERFTAYERLDHQLDEMVSGLTELLRGAAELRRRTNEDITTALGRLEGLIADDRRQQRHLLTSLHTELDAAQQRTTALSQAIETVQSQLTDITTQLPRDRPDDPTTTHVQPPIDPPNGSS